MSTPKSPSSSWSSSRPVWTSERSGRRPRRDFAKRSRWVRWYEIPRLRTEDLGLRAQGAPAAAARFFSDARSVLSPRSSVLSLKMKARRSLVASAAVLALPALAAAQDFGQTDPYQTRFKEKATFQVKFRVPEKGD